LISESCLNCAGHIVTESQISVDMKISFFNALKDNDNDQGTGNIEVRSVQSTHINDLWLA